jgi:hypothetical protein
MLVVGVSGGEGQSSRVHETNHLGKSHYQSGVGAKVRAYNEFDAPAVLGIPCVR